MTGTGLRSGAPSIVVPFMGGQFTAGRLAYAIRVATEHEGILGRAAALDETLHAENGVGNAVRVVDAILKPRR